MERLRAPGGCPWDHEQTIQSLRGFVLEETYEVLDAIDRDDHDALRGEIGDLLFEGVFLAQIEADDGRFSVADSLHGHRREADPPPSARVRGRRGRRHAGQGGRAVGTDQVARTDGCRAGSASLLSGVPKSMPSLLRAHEIGTRVAAVGFDWASTADVVDKIEEEVAELREAVAHEGHERAEEEMGDLLFSIANLARKLGIEPESALRKANEKFSEALQRRWRAIFEQRGSSVHDATLEEMEEVWRR